MTTLLIDLAAFADALLGPIHFVAASLSLLLGPVVLLRPKGDRWHRLWGRSWVTLMLGVDLSALATYDITGRPNLFHGFALLSLWALIPGFLAIRSFKKTHQPEALRRHSVCMHWAYFGVAAAGAWQGISALTAIHNGGDFTELLWILGALTGFTSWGYGRWLNGRFPPSRSASGLASSR